MWCGALEQPVQLLVWLEFRLWKERGIKLSTTVAVYKAAVLSTLLHGLSVANLPAQIVPFTVTVSHGSAYTVVKAAQQVGRCLDDIDVTTVRCHGLPVRRRSFTFLFGGVGIISEICTLAFWIQSVFAHAVIIVKRWILVWCPAAIDCHVKPSSSSFISLKQINWQFSAGMSMEVCQVAWLRPGLRMLAGSLGQQCFI